MLGKDYMLAIIIVNYEDSIWNDQTLELDSDLPPGWRTIRDSSGTYYWHIPTGTTQWHHPAQNTENDPKAVRLKSLSDGAQGAKASTIGSPLPSVNDSPLAFQEDYPPNTDRDSKCFAVRSLGWVEIPEEDLVPGKSSIAVNNCIQQLSNSKCEGRDAMGAWGEGQDMVMVLNKDTLSLVDPLDHSLIHCQPIINIRVWGVGCNSGRDFAFVACDKDTCMLKCHVFRCDVPAKAIATMLHRMCSKLVAEKASRHPGLVHSPTVQALMPVERPLQVDVKERLHKFPVQYVGYLPVPQAMGMDVLNRAIESIMNTTEREEWEPIDIHVTDTVLSFWKGQEEVSPFWECQMRYLTFLGVGHDMHNFAVIMDTGRQHFECHVFWCEPDAGAISEAVQAACMVQYQKCLVAQTPPLKSKMVWANSKVKRATSMDISSLDAAAHHEHSSPKFAASSVRKSMAAFFETFKGKQSVTPAP